MAKSECKVSVHLACVQHTEIKKKQKQNKTKQERESVLKRQSDEVMDFGNKDTVKRRSAH